MQRKRFIKLSGFSAASLLFTTINPLTGQTDQVLAAPDEVSVLSSGKWLPLSKSGDQWIYQHISVRLHTKAGGTTVQVSAPGGEIEKIKIGWKHRSSPAALFLGDHWERSYGDLAWKTGSPIRKAPWYLFIHDGSDTFAFGVKTGAASICYWQAGPERLELFMDTHSGGMGFIPGERMLTAAEIISTKSLPGETPFQTDIRFCKMMCDKPVLPAKPVYGINDWYFAYGNNSKELILRITGIMAELAGDSSNPPFSVVDDGWSLKNVKGNADYSGDDFNRPDDKFGDMSVVSAEIKKLGMRPGLWTRPLLANGNDPQMALIPLREGQINQKERYLDPTIPGKPSAHSAYDRII